MERKKCILVGVTGGIAAYKALDLVSKLKKKDYEVHVLMSENACKFVTPLSFKTLSKNEVAVNTFDDYENDVVKHISLASKADAFIIAPASANVIAKIANGLADDMLTTTFLASDCFKIICPAMNTKMLENPITQANIQKLKNYGMTILEEENCGLLACGDVGKGRLVDNNEILASLDYLFTKDLLKGKKVLISAGPTQEALDPVRYISNHSSGKMGYALALAAYNLKADVTLISGPCNLDRPKGIKIIDIKNAKMMFEAIKDNYAEADIIIKAAAVADYTPSRFSEEKIKKIGSKLLLELNKTDDILKWLGENRKEGQFICGFAMETENMLENAKKKLESKKVDLIIANSLNEKGAGFKVDTNHLTLIAKEMIKEIPLDSKYNLALKIFEYIMESENK